MADDMQELYKQLCAPMPTHKVRKGGPDLDYITTEGCTTRLNTALGPDSWSFRITERWYDAEADECCVRGTLTVQWPSGRVTEHEDIGNQIPNRRRAQGGEVGDIIEIGNDWKGARSDCLKRCATDIGVGLWLYSKERPRTAPAAKPEPMQPSPSNGIAAATNPADSPTCEECGKHLHPAKFGDGTVWTADDLGERGRRKHGRTLCMNCYRKAGATSQSPTAEADHGSPFEIPPATASISYVAPEANHSLDIPPMSEWDAFVGADAARQGVKALEELSANYLAEEGADAALPVALGGDLRKALEGLGLVQTEQRVQVVTHALGLTPSEITVGHARALLDWARMPEAKAQAAAMLAAQAARAQNG